MLKKFNMCFIKIKFVLYSLIITKLNYNNYYCDYASFLMGFGKKLYPKGQNIYVNTC